MERLLVAIIAFTMATPCFAQTAEEMPKQNALVEKAVLCMRRAAVRLEPSGESPQSITEAALWVCNAERTALANYLFQHPPGFSNEANERGVAVAQVVGVRLCKKTKDCFFATVP